MEFKNFENLPLLNPTPDSPLYNIQGENLELEAINLYNNFKDHVFIDENEIARANFNYIQEIHPYLLFRNRMIDKPKGYIIGTFPPVSYLRNTLLLNNEPIFNRPFFINDIQIGQMPRIPFFHGNDLKLWEFLQINPLTVDDVLRFLKEKKWIYSDIIYSCSRKEINNPADNNLRNIIVNVDLLNEIIYRNDSPYIWFTSSSVYNSTGIKLRNGFIDISSNQAYNLFIHALQKGSFKIEVEFENTWYELIPANNNILVNINFTIKHRIRLNNKNVYTIYTGPSPSASASRRLGSNDHYKNWKLKPQNQNYQTPTNEYRKQVYSRFINFEI